PRAGGPVRRPTPLPPGSTRRSDPQPDRGLEDGGLYQQGDRRPGRRDRADGRAQAPEDPRDLGGRMNAVSDDLSPGPRPLDPSIPLAQRVDEACDRFEAAWMRGERPRVEDFLTGLDDGECPAFLRELLKIDLAYRRGHGEQPRFREYCA